MHLILKVLIITNVIAIIYGLAQEEKDLPVATSLRPSPTYSFANEARKRKDHYFLYPFYGWHALTWIYWIKVKLVVVAFFAYTAFIWAVSYMGKYYNNCSNAGHHVYYDHGHYRSFAHMDIPQPLQTTPKRRKRRSILWQPKKK